MGIIARYGLTCERRIDAVKAFAASIGGEIEFIPGEIKNFKVAGKVYRIGFDPVTDEYLIHDDSKDDDEC